MTMERIGRVEGLGLGALGALFSLICKLMLRIPPYSHTLLQFCLFTKNSVNAFRLF